MPAAFETGLAVSCGDAEKQAEDRNSPAPLRGAVNELLVWFARNRRDLPWRREPRNPYHVWLSETMLQQTQVATVISYFERWARELPSIAALAAAPLDRVLKLWEGLGYYARARNLHRGAQAVAASESGELPQSVDALMALPGIGRYTAGAIASLAFNQDAPALDGNVKRVLSRLFAIGADWRMTPWPAELGKPPERLRKPDDLLWALDAALLPPGRAGPFNEATMELGATVCLPRAPRCDACPLRAMCAGRASGAPEAYPVKLKKTPTPARIALTAVVIDAAGRMLLGQRPPSGLLGGLWEFVSSVAGPADRFELGAASPALETVLATRAGVRAHVADADFIGVIRHTFTHFRLERHVA
ncbi:MAG: A/G-specific adenine glycosylase, partial [Thermoflexales bacterium]